MSHALPKLAVPLAPLLPRLELDGQASEILAGKPDAAAGIAALSAASRFPEAVRLAAHALPKREAVWWACMCARAVPDPNLPEADLKALAAAEAPERFARLVTLATVLISAGRRRDTLLVSDVCDQIQVSPTELREDIDTVLEPGHVVSMEPMLTIPEGMPGAGGYREHDILVIGEDGAEDITRYPYGPGFNLVG